MTLTYNQENIPKGASLVPDDTQEWLKRLRASFAPEKLRYYLVGEYGDETNRPHYHGAIFGLDADRGGGIDGRGGLVQKTWGKGHTFVGELTPASAGYIGGYVTKKMTSKDDGRLNGRLPEFARMSLRPGIGAVAMPEVLAVLRSPWGVKEVAEHGDVPYMLREGRKSLPLGRYLRRKLREGLGRGPDAPFESYRSYALEMRGLLADHAQASPSKAWSLGKIFVDMTAQSCLNIEAKAKITTGRSM